MANRLHYLAGCLDDHTVDTFFDIEFLAEGIAHRWPDGTYSATRLDWHKRSGEDRERLFLAWLDQCHAGQTIRRPHEWAMGIVYEPMEVPSEV